jgi:hypothetical protein
VDASLPAMWEWNASPRPCERLHKVHNHQDGRILYELPIQGEPGGEHAEDFREDMMINYGSIERPSIPASHIKKEREESRTYLARRISRLKELGLCITCGKVPVSRFSRCLNCRLGRRVPA